MTLVLAPRDNPETVYNFEVANQHVYYFSKDGLLVHNATYLEKALKLASDATAKTFCCDRN